MATATITITDTEDGKININTSFNPAISNESNSPAQQTAVEFMSWPNELETDHATAVNSLMALTDDQRMEVFGLFCMHCGDNNPRCQCWNDE